MMVTVSLAMNMMRMARENCLVRKLIASETIGSATVICTDKTGTLTENKMTVSGIYYKGEFLAPEKLRCEKLLTNFCVNGTADITEEKGRGPRFIGNPTECALLAAAKKAGVDYKEIRKNSDIAHVYSFSSETKNMTTVVNDVVYTKGSPEKILALCSISDEERAAAEREIIKFQEQAARVIAFAHKTEDGPFNFDDRISVESGLTFDGFAAISDPLRVDVYNAVKECRRAGIELKMLTGDNIITATAIAGQLKILDGGGTAVEAAEIENLPDEEFLEQLKNIRVIARSTPIVKMRVVKALKAAGNVVAVTGDGINDAPALKAADVGIAMGIAGTEVSKEAADIVLLDDSFKTITTAVKWGRGIFENFKRFIQFQLTVNFSSVFVVLLSILIGYEAPFTALQILWINLIMDGPPAITLGLEPIRGDIMAKKPTPRNSGIITRSMLARIIIIGAFVTAVSLSQRAWNFLGVPADQMSTVLFGIFALSHLFNSFNARELGNASIFRNIHRNRPFLIAVAATFVLQIVMTQWGGAFFGTVALDALTWLKVIGIAASVLAISELYKFSLRIFTNKKPQTAATR
jgi:Ca2+-transporting ATPase